ncbi:MAG TPA: sporulation integral membrane protein YtvI [Candidatus Binatia bacterium]|nr:sporulation integral membrane protein YtvI [Candidatus Binatia bacterium]
MLKDDFEKYYPGVKKTLHFILVMALILVAFKLAFVYLLPFVFAFVIAAAMEPFIAFLVSRRLPRGPAIVLVMIVVYGVLFTVAFFSISRLVREVAQFSSHLPDYSRAFTAFFNDMMRLGRKLYLHLPKEAIAPLQDTLHSMAATLSQVLKSLAGSVINILSALPDMLLFAMFTIIATFFVAYDKDEIRGFMAKQLPASTYGKFAALKHSLFHSLVGFLKSQGILMALNFIECFIGLSLIGIRYAFLLAILIAVVDILPVLGSGTVLVPWGVANLLLGHTRTGAALLLLYIVITIVRYIVEPKVVGSQLGLHPLVALIAMFVGLKAFGVLGLVLGPAIVVTAIAVMDAGLVQKYRE